MFSCYFVGGCFLWFIVDFIFVCFACVWEVFLFLFFVLVFCFVFCLFLLGGDGAAFFSSFFKNKHHKLWNLT